MRRLLLWDDSAWRFVLLILISVAGIIIIAVVRHDLVFTEEDGSEHAIQSAGIQLLGKIVTPGLLEFDNTNSTINPEPAGIGTLRLGNNESDTIRVRFGDILDVEEDGAEHAIRWEDGARRFVINAPRHRHCHSCWNPTRILTPGLLGATWPLL